ncbi:hypothetical protein C0Q70_05308 [Pomacea canaliculata]|uniref:Uncharacterized protein n=1 Tax=Pomacea canaliculata TaxID=400727 RepID=A0A2T7PKT2_POMCA|nr:hypothetical protein C0Q70_05308 [Pomacea canaliculata]
MFVCAEQPQEVAKRPNRAFGSFYRLMQRHSRYLDEQAFAEKMFRLFDMNAARAHQPLLVLPSSPPGSPEAVRTTPASLQCQPQPADHRLASFCRPVRPASSSAFGSHCTAPGRQTTPGHTHNHGPLHRLRSPSTKPHIACLPLGPKDEPAVWTESCHRRFHSVATDLRSRVDLTVTTVTSCEKHVT